MLKCWAYGALGRREEFDAHPRLFCLKWGGSLSEWIGNDFMTKDLENTSSLAWQVLEDWKVTGLLPSAFLWKLWEEVSLVSVARTVGLAWRKLWRQNSLFLFFSFVSIICLYIDDFKADWTEVLGRCTPVSLNILYRYWRVIFYLLWAVRNTVPFRLIRSSSLSLSRTYMNRSFGHRKRQHLGMMISLGNLLTYWSFVGGEHLWQAAWDWRALTWRDGSDSDLGSLRALAFLLQLTSSSNSFSLLRLALKLEGEGKNIDAAKNWRQMCTSTALKLRRVDPSFEFFQIVFPKILMRVLWEILRQFV